MGVAGTGINFPTTARGQLKNRKRRQKTGREIIQLAFICAQLSNRGIYRFNKMKNIGSVVCIIN